ncbi:hypothetical protein ACWER6_28800 [Streptomyces sp. NPDC004009]
MNAHRARRLAAVSAIGVLMAGGAVVGTATGASAATHSQVTRVSTDRGCGGWGGCYGRGGFGFRNGYGFNNGFGFYNGYGYGYNTPVVVVVAG